MRAITWIKERGAEFAEVSLGDSYLRAAGLAVGAVPMPYRLEYELECADGFVTRSAARSGSARPGTEIAVSAGGHDALMGRRPQALPVEPGLSEIQIEGEVSRKPRRFRQRFGV